MPNLIMCQFRFHNSILLNKDLYIDNGKGIDLKNVQPSDSGDYTCRANNEGRGIYSNIATLSVRGTINMGYQFSAKSTLCVGGLFVPRLICFS